MKYIYLLLLIFSVSGCARNVTNKPTFHYGWGLTKGDCFIVKDEIHLIKGNLSHDMLKPYNEKREERDPRLIGTLQKGTKIRFLKITSTPNYVIGESIVYYGKIETGEFQNNRKVAMGEVLFWQGIDKGLTDKYLTKQDF